MSNKFVRLTNKPAASDPYIYLYNNAKNGGVSYCINGSPMDKTCNVLSNCVGWACARFNHIYNILTGYNGMKYKSFCCNAENFIEKAKAYGLEIGMTPRPGAIMVWQKGNTLSGSDGAGHVCIVEEAVSVTEVNTSESGYGYAIPVYCKNRKKGADGRWGQSSAYTFRGFIYNPAVKDDDTKPVENKDSDKCKFNIGDVVKMTNNAPIYGKTSKFASWVYSTKLYIREIDGSKITVSIYKEGAITGFVDKKYLNKVK